MNRTKIIDMVVAVFVAIFLWAYVINVVNPPTTMTIRDVPVELKGAEVLTYNKLAISGDGDYTVDVVLSGARNDLTGLTADDLTAIADLSPLKQGQNYMPVEVNCMVNNVAVSEVRSQKIQVYVEELVVVDKPLNIQFVNNVEGYEPTILQSGSDAVAVSGAKSLVDSVTEVRVDIDVASLAIDMPKTVSYLGVPLDSAGNYVDSLSFQENFDIKAVLYQLKTVPLHVTIKGSPAYSATIKGSTFPESVIIKGTAKKLENISSVDGGSVSVEGVTEDKYFTLSPELPLGVYFSETSPELSGTVKLVDVAKTSFSFAADSLEIQGLAEGLTCTILDADDVSVNATSTINNIKQLKGEGLMPYVDVTGMTAGQFVVPILIRNVEDEVIYDIVPEEVQVLISLAEGVTVDENGQLILPQAEGSDAENAAN